ncbi:hypothetical protein RJ640_026294 [Escallonia rubra]|uniref:Uncharacterized protein n=1 Tax=Escallonia rubra TaxID=112253 RepID=A0AA88RNE1_9ASTE|nr:hypothetical protein RJ640_026294 [Escallonia rubra]
MGVISRNTAAPSTLNPNAPMFVPSAYRTVEDFSDQWWHLVHSSPWFRDYWLRECFCDTQNDPPFSDNFDPALPDIDALFDDPYIVREEGKEGPKDLVKLGVSKWGKNRGVGETPRYGQKVPKIVNVKVSPRPIQQPR